jgi:hypothetical protein
MGTVFILAAAALLGSGVFLAGPYDSRLDSSLLPVVAIAFIVAALVLVACEVIYLGRAVAYQLAKPHWLPPAVGLVALIASGLGLMSTGWNVHLYAPWIFFFLVTLAIASLGSVIILAASVWGLAAQRNKGPGNSQSAG